MSDFQIFGLSCPSPPGSSPPKKTFKEPKAEGTVGRGLCNLPAVCQGHFEGQNDRRGENRWKALEEWNPYELPVGAAVPQCGCPEAPSTVLNCTLLLSGCSSPVCGPAQRLHLLREVFPGPWCPLIFSVKSSEHTWSHLSATPPCLLHL